MTPSHYTIQHLPTEERPRERLLRHGADAVATAELIAIILGSGMRGMPVLQLAQEILMHFGNLEQLANATVNELCQIKGLGKAKALQLQAAFQLGLRIARQVPEERLRIEQPVQAYRLIKEEMEREGREIFVIIMLDIKGYLIKYEKVSVGTLTKTLVHPREVFNPAIRHHAASIILAHNHPSGDATPSKEDLVITKTLIDAGQIIGISVKDHIIIAKNNYFSLRETNKICFS